MVLRTISDSDISSTHKLMNRQQLGYMRFAVVVVADSLTQLVFNLIPVTGMV